MADSCDDKLPVILDGTYFTIQSKNGDKVVAKCLNCVSG